MTITSMTGFARAEAELPGGRLVWELRSVNGKALEVRFRLPAGFDAFEPDLRRRAMAALSRGNVQANLQIVRRAAGARPTIDRALLADLAALADELVTAGHAAPPTADGLLALRGVIDFREPAAEESDDGAATQAVVEAFDRALVDLKRARESEGAAIAAMLEQRLDAIEDLASRANADPARTPDAIGNRLRGQIELVLGAGATVDAARLAQEVAILATRADIAEELDRLGAHLSAGRALLKSGEPVGRRLDFLAQEFNRESNTICSKSNAATLTAIGMELKVVIDQFREQVQNVE